MINRIVRSADNVNREGEKQLALHFDLTSPNSCNCCRMIRLVCFFADSVDRIIRKDDKNKDGFIDPVEYQEAKSRGLKAMKKAIDKQLKQHGSRSRFY